VIAEYETGGRELNALRAGSAPGAGRIAVVSARVGAGHDGAAAELTRRLREAGHEVERHDFLDLLPAGTGAVLSAAYHLLLKIAPGGYQRIHDATERAGRPGLLVRALFRASHRRALAAVPTGTDAVVCTYPGASQVYGALRRCGRLGVPVVTYLTDFSVHGLWVAEGVDAHLAAHAVPAAQAHAQGAAGVRVVAPVVDPRFHPACDGERERARLRFLLPPQAKLALLVAGSWGVGQVRQAAHEVAESGQAVPVIVCGRNASLAAELRQEGFRYVFGWVDNMPTLMRAVDVLVQNAGGLSSLEAFASGLPVVSYRCIPGHGRTNAAALEEAGLAPWVQDRVELGPVLADLIDGPAGGFLRAAGPALISIGLDVVSAITAPLDMVAPAWAAARPGVTAGPARRRLARLAVAGAVTAVLAIAAPLADAYTGPPYYLAPAPHAASDGRR
jgi:UDP-N-acetylglucosamine:LPS N-acetylglucosamine transferase